MNDFAPDPDEAQARLDANRERLREAEAEATAGADEGGAADALARFGERHPWQLAAAGAALGVVIALLLRRPDREK